MAASTDCLNVDADTDRRPRAASPLYCGHVPGNRHGAVFNTGVLWFSPAARAFARTWAEVKQRTHPTHPFFPYAKFHGFCTRQLVFPASFFSRQLFRRMFFPRHSSHPPHLSPCRPLVLAHVLLPQATLALTDSWADDQGVYSLTPTPPYPPPPH